MSNIFLSARISSELNEAVLKFAEENNLSKSQVIINAISEYLEFSPLSLSGIASNQKAIAKALLRQEGVRPSDKKNLRNIIEN